MNLTEKLVQRCLVSKTGKIPKVKAGDFVSIKPAHVMTHDNTSPVIGKFKNLGVSRIMDSRQPVFALDHDIQNTTPQNLTKYAKIAEFAMAHGIDFYSAGRGIGHQVMVEEGYAFPGSVVVASDSHSNMYGGVGCLGTPVVRTDAASIWATSQTWWQVPPVANVILEGQLVPGATGKDVIIALCGYFNKDEVLNYAIEFTGDGVGSLSVEDRLTIANMTTEWGALTGLFPIDSVLAKWLKDRAEFLARRGPSGVVSDPLTRQAGYQNPRVNNKTIDQVLSDPIKADSSARYARVLRLDLSTVTPHVSGPNHVKTMKRLKDIEKENIKIHKAYIVSCVNSRLQDLDAAAEVLKGKKIAEGVELYVAAASSEVQKQAEIKGTWDALLAAGAKTLPPGCGPCVGLGQGLLLDGEVGISATNRNFKGRMGSPKAQAYLSSPAVVAASALAGKIVCPPGNFSDGPLKASMDEVKGGGVGGGEGEKAPLLNGFPAKLQGPGRFCDSDNINTDGIYPGKYTYRDDLTPQQMGDVAMENYDTTFASSVHKGDILIAGYNFGTGSSREQAATALKYKGIPCVIAGSYSTTYTRNAFNNGFLVLESPELIDHLRSRSKNNAETKTQLLSSPVTIDLASWSVEAEGGKFPVRVVGEAAQDLVLQGGLENWIKVNAK